MKRLMSYYHPVEPSVDFAALEQAVLTFWEADETFEKSVEQRPVSNSYVFYDGPPFATGLPHHGHIMTSVIKDMVPRFFTMCGKRVERRLGWDCHGVPAEFEVEKKLNLHGKEDIERLGMANFNEACRSIVLRYAQEWKSMLARIGRWVDMEDDYKTMDSPYMETMWWVFKQLWERGLIYEDYKVVHYSWRLSTPVSNFEATLDDAYRDREDPAVIAKFKLDDEHCFLLAWTTTPWTLPSNMALAVNPIIPYCKVRYTRDGEEACYVVARELVGEIFPEGEYEVESELAGGELVGRTYQPLMDYFASLKGAGAFRIVAADFVSAEEGTGIVHMAPAFGEDDFFAAKAEDIPLVNPVDDSGRFTAEVSDFAGMNVFDANSRIIDKLLSEGKLLSYYTITHPYPHDWRTDTPLIYRAIPSWYVQVTALKDRLLSNNERINWVPSHIKHGAFGKWLENARDWAISRSRYWGTPIPVWRCKDCECQIVIGSIRELEEKSGTDGITDIHRHFIDDIQIPCPQCGGSMSRIPDVMDCWFESGSMPYGQIHYPFENKEWFDANFPADFIVEYTGQIRGWFYTLVVVSAALFDQPPFHNVVVHGVTLGEDGRKMSKRLKNYPDPDELIATYGADALRVYFVNHPLMDAVDAPVQERGVAEAFRQYIIPVWNAFSFLVRYAALDGWRPSEERHPATFLDRWIRSRACELSYQIGDAIRGYHLRSCVTLLQSFVDDLTNWYIRRSRNRFWKSERDDDKAAAYETLHEVLVLFSKVTAPLTPFISEVIFKNLTGEESVHLQDWPTPDRALIDTALNRKMSTIRQIASLGLAVRAKAQIKVRQPLSKVSIRTDQSLTEGDLALIADELNVKSVEVMDEVGRYAQPIIKPNPAIIGPRFGRDTPRIIKAAKSGNFEMLPDGRVRIAGNDAWIFDDDVIHVHYEGKPGYACETKGDLVVVLDTSLSEDLRREGIARDLVRQIQTLRKEEDFPLDERIAVGIFTNHKDILQAISEFSDYICAETLAESLVTKQGEEWARSRGMVIDGISVEVAVRPTV